MQVADIALNFKNLDINGISSLNIVSYHWVGDHSHLYWPCGCMAGLHRPCSHRLLLTDQFEVKPSITLPTVWPCSPTFPSSIQPKFCFAESLFRNSCWNKMNYLKRLKRLIFQPSALIVHSLRLPSTPLSVITLLHHYSSAWASLVLLSVLLLLLLRSHYFVLLRSPWLFRLNEQGNLMPFFSSSSSLSPPAPQPSLLIHVAEFQDLGNGGWAGGHRPGDHHQGSESAWRKGGNVAC